MGKLDGKVAVVTGGGSGIGLASAELFGREGATVVVADLDQAAQEAAVTKIGAGATGLRCDISEPSDLEALRVHVEKEHGRLDIVFANAGGGRPGTLELVSEEDFDLTADTNFKGTFYTIQKLVPLMTAGGSIVLNTSIQGSKGIPGFPVYAATKAAIRSLARTLTAELSAGGIRVNAVAPGYIDTDILRKAGATEEMIRADNLRVQEEVPLSRKGTPDEVAQAVLFLASSDASYISGVELPVDGGVAQV